MSRMPAGGHAAPRLILMLFIAFGLAACERTGSFVAENEDTTDFDQFRSDGGSRGNDLENSPPAVPVAPPSDPVFVNTGITPPVIDTPIPGVPTVPVDPTLPSAGRIFKFTPSDDVSTLLGLVLVQLRPGDRIEFSAGYFELSRGIQLNGLENIQIRGAGRDATVLSFKTVQGSSTVGIFADNVRGFTVTDLTVLDSPGDGIKMKGVDFGTLRNVRTIWSSGRNLGAQEELILAHNYQQLLNVPCTDPARHDPNTSDPSETDTTSPDYTVSPSSGRYGIYPVESSNILVDLTESVGASDAGIYVGQTNNAIISNSRAAYNVMGFEIENVQGGEYANNVAECNTGGFLIYDLDNISQYGKRSRMYGNLSNRNNSYNFAASGFVGRVPRGSGFITLAYDKIDIFDNRFINNDTAGIILTSYELVGDPGDRQLDMYSEGVHIYNNSFGNNGNNLPNPDFAAIVTTMGGGDAIASALPALVGLKNAASGQGYRGGHIVWDGLADDFDPDCPYPLDYQGRPVPADADGRPEGGWDYPNPACRYNAYKFDENGNRKAPEWWFACIDAGTNTFLPDSLTYSNFHGTEGLELALALADGSDNPDDYIAALAAQQNNNARATNDIGEHDCEALFGSTLPPLEPVVIEEYEPSSDLETAPTPEQIQALCESDVQPGQLNYAAIYGRGLQDGPKGVDCPRLDQYNLFSDPEDPRSAPNGDGVPFVLNTKLFSDFAVKYRVAYVPPGTAAVYQSFDDTADPDDTIQFPVGTVLAKTFAFPNEPEGTETVVETRLLIKRERSADASGNPRTYWVGLPYIWETDPTGKRIARLRLEGDTVSASWHHTDVDSGQVQVGATDQYVVPDSIQCLQCHSNDDNETGAPPIGPKVRNLNRPYSPESAWLSAQADHPVRGVNQLQYWCSNGMMIGCPNLGVNEATQIAQNVPRIPKFNVPGDSGQPADSGADIEARVRAYLEANCAHCHNPDGQASNTGFFLDVFRAVDASYGICKGPTATGSEGSGGRSVDFHPTRSDDSIVTHRIGPSGNNIVAARMPPLARSVVHDEAFELVERWINTVLVKDNNVYPNSESCD